MSTRPQSLQARAALAILLLVGFYVIALAVVALLLFIPYAEFRWAHRIDFRIALFCVGGGLIVLWSAIPKPDVFREPGPRLTPVSQPRLFELIGGIAHRTGQEAPSEVYLIHDVNAWVSQRGGVLGLGSRRIMGLGMPVLETLDVSELEAVLSHEFGHYDGGDTKLGPFLYQTRAAIGRTIQGLASAGGAIGALQEPFIAYGNLFLRVTQKISRAQEATADALAARVAGPKPLIEGLKKIEVTALAYDGYLNTEFEPAVGMGLLPPIGDGFARFLRAPVIRTRVEELAADVVAKHRARAANEDAALRQYESHPRLHERIDAIEAMGLSDPPLDTRPAIALLDDVPALDAELTRQMIRPDLAEASRAGEWRDVAQLGHVALYRQVRAENAEDLRGARIAELPALLPALVQALLARQRTETRPGWNSELEIRERRARFVVGAAMCAALADQGFTFTTAPGEDLIARGPRGECAPLHLLGELGAGRVSPAEFQRQCEELGIGDIALG